MKMVVLYFAFKSLPYAVSALAIYLGYDLFIRGVTGEASLIVNATTFQGQLLNAAPGLFFGVGGIVALIVTVWKGAGVEFTDDSIEFVVRT